MTRFAVLAAVAVMLVPSALAALNDDDPRAVLGSGDRVPSVAPGVEDTSHVAHYPPGVKARAAPVTHRQTFDVAPGVVNGYPCGGLLPPCSVLACESGGDPTARNPRSSASGLWQVLRSTWAGFGGFAEAWLAPADVQNAFAAGLWSLGRGASHWRSCL